MSRPQALGPLAQEAPAELRLAQALRDLIGDALAEVPAPSPASPELRSVGPVERSSDVAMHVQLTDREREVIALMARGFGNAEIGARMYLAERTVKNYAGMAIGKLNATNRAHAVAIALRMGFVDPTLDELLGMDPTEKEGATRP